MALNPKETKQAYRFLRSRRGRKVIARVAASAGKPLSAPANAGTPVIGGGAPTPLRTAQPATDVVPRTRFADDTPWFSGQAG